jgi:DNA-binding MarR family transcriptional regulator
MVRLGRDVHLNVLLLANRNLDALEEICQAHGITHQQYVALWTLCLADEPRVGVPMGAVADGLLNRASDTTRLIDRLERAGLAERSANPTDRRSVLVRATRQGQRVFAAVTPKLQEFHRRQWSSLDADEVDTLNELLAKALWGGSA